MVLQTSVKLADCVKFACNLDRKLYGKYYESYLGVFNFGQVKQVELTIHDIVRENNANFTTIVFYAVVGNDNEGLNVDILDVRSADHCFGRNVDWGQRFQSETEIDFIFHVNDRSKLEFHLIDGGLFERYLYCNSRPVLAGNNFNVTIPNLAELQNTAYHQLKYLTDTRHSSELNANECGVMKVGHRNVRSWPGRNTAELEFWCLNGDNGLNADIKYVQTMMALVNLRDVNEPHICLANLLKPLRADTMYYVYICSDGFEKINFYSHQIYFNVRIFRAPCIDKDLIHFSLKCRGAKRSSGRSFWAYDETKEVDRTSNLFWCTYKYSRNLMCSVSLNDNRERGTVGRERFFYTTNFGFWNDFWLSLHSQQGNPDEDLHTKWQQRYYHDFFIGNCSANKEFKGDADLPITNLKNIGDTMQTKLFNNDSFSNAMFFSGVLPSEVRLKVKTQDYNLFKQSSLLCMVEADVFTADKMIMVYDLAGLEGNEEIQKSMNTQAQNNARLRAAIGDTCPVIPVGSNRKERPLTKFQVEMEHDYFVHNFYFFGNFDCDVHPVKGVSPKRYCGVKNIPPTVRTYVLSRTQFIKRVHFDSIIHRPLSIKENNPVEMAYPRITLEHCPQYGVSETGRVLRGYFAPDGQPGAVGVLGVRYNFVKAFNLEKPIPATTVYIMCLNKQDVTNIVGYNDNKSLPENWRVYAISSSSVRHHLSSASEPMFDTLLDYPVVQFTSGLNYYEGDASTVRQAEDRYPGTITEEVSEEEGHGRRDDEERRRDDDDKRKRRRDRSPDRKDSRSRPSHDSRTRIQPRYRSEAGQFDNDSRSGSVANCKGHDELNMPQDGDGEEQMVNWLPDGFFGGLVGAISAAVGAYLYW